MADLFTATTAAEVEEALARRKKIDALEGTPPLSPLLSAIKRGELEVVDCLLNHGANFTRVVGPWCPLQWAAWEGHAAIVERLIKAGAGINDNQQGRESTALILASHQGHVDVMDCLLSLGADTEAKDRSGETALMMACQEGRVDVVDLLLAAGANVNVQDKRNVSALMWAAKRDHLSIVDRLVVYGADFNHQDNGGENALMWACLSDRIELVDRLLSLGCDVDLKNNEGWTALMMTCSTGRRKDIVQLLLDHGANPSICNNNRERAIDLAVASAEIRNLLNGLILFPLSSCLLR